MTSTKNAPLHTINDVVDAIPPNLAPNQKYSLEQLVGKGRWNATHKGRRIQLGAQFKALVDGGDLPVISAGKRSDNSQLYQKQ